MLETLLLIFKVLLLILLYYFVYHIIRSAMSSLRRSEEEFSESAPSPASSQPLPERLSPADDESPFPAVPRSEESRERGERGPEFDLLAGVAPHFVVKESPSLPKDKQFPLSGGATIGRSSASSIVIDDEFVSSAHARVLGGGQYLFIEDLGSTNGTYVGGRRISEAEQLKLHTPVKIGSTVFLYEEH